MINIVPKFDGQRSVVWESSCSKENKEGPADDWPDQGASAADRDHDQDPSGGEPSGCTSNAAIAGPLVT